MLFTEGDRVLGEWHVQIRQPPFIVTDEAMRINKINLDEPGLTYAQFTKERFLKMREFPAKPIFAGHNCAFDRSFLRQIVGKDDGCHYHSIDTMVLGNSLKAMGIFDPPSLKLADLSKFLGVELIGDAHNARTDVHAAFECFLKIREILV
jgi:DNA polymerase III alpha subunit (gram-positive type)